MSNRSKNAKEPLARDALEQLIAEIAPKHFLSKIEPALEDYANKSYVLVLKSPTGLESKFVLKHYKDHRAQPGLKARLEYNTLALLQAHNVPVPEPTYLDEQGMLFGSPVIVTRYVQGESMWASTKGKQCAQELGKMLARIHTVPVSDNLKNILLDANTEALWFLKPEGIPPYMSVHPDGQVIWDTIPKLLAEQKEYDPVLVHMDFWMGNVLWHNRKISAVIDWEEASYGDPAIDVAYCRMDMFLSRMGLKAANEFLSVYETETGQAVENLSLWEYAAAPRCMHDPAWEQECRQALKAYIAETFRRTELGPKGVNQ